MNKWPLCCNGALTFGTFSLDTHTHTFSFMLEYMTDPKLSSKLLCLQNASVWCVVQVNWKGDIKATQSLCFVSLIDLHPLPVPLTGVSKFFYFATKSLKWPVSLGRLAFPTLALKRNRFIEQEAFKCGKQWDCLWKDWEACTSCFEYKANPRKHLS